MNKPSNPIFVTQPSLPDLGEYTDMLQDIWDSKWLTNNGRFHQIFENKIAEYLGVKHLSIFSNGTLALIIALKKMGITGEVITTPYSFVATAHALKWNGIEPVFCDVDLIYGNLDPNKIEALITPQTSAILPVHVYGNPAEVNKIQKIADKFNLKVIYDSAHAFGVKLNGESILQHGDLSVLSFHATKTFNTIEGGAIVCHDAKTKEELNFLKNFGFESETSVIGIGINGKMNEFQAAFGLLQLNSIDNDILARKNISDHYKNELKNIIGIRFLEEMKDVIHNYSYFPIFIETDYPLTRDELYKKLKDNNIHSRRYFYPLISDFPTYKDLPSSSHDKLLNAATISNAVICLPIYPNLKLEEVNYIISLI